jgi:transposase
MANFIAFNRDQAFLLPPDMKAWLPEDDLAHFVVAAVERVPVGAFEVPARAGGKPQYHPRLMLALLVYSYANGIFSSRRIERATYRDTKSANRLSSRSLASSKAPWDLSDLGYVACSTQLRSGA